MLFIKPDDVSGVSISYLLFFLLVFSFLIFYQTEDRLWCCDTILKWLINKMFASRYFNMFPLGYMYFTSRNEQRIDSSRHRKYFYQSRLTITNIVWKWLLRWNDEAMRERETGRSTERDRKGVREKLNQWEIDTKQISFHIQPMR